MNAAEDTRAPANGATAHTSYRRSARGRIHQRVLYAQILQGRLAPQGAAVLRHLLAQSALPPTSAPVEAPESASLTAPENASLTARERAFLYERVSLYRHGQYRGT